MSIQELNSGSAQAISAPTVMDFPARQAVFVAFDTETTGLSPVAAKLVELSGVKFTGTGHELSTFQSLINPESPIPYSATSVHGITDDMVEEAPLADEVVPAFFNWATHAAELGKPSGVQPIVLVAHNAPFDISFLEVALCKMSAPVPANVVLDTLPIARALLDGPMNFQLKTLVEYLEVTSTGYHRALDDSYHVRDVFLKLLERMPADATIGDLALISGKLLFMDRSAPEDESSWLENPEFVIIRNAIDSGFSLRIEYSGVRKTQRVVTPRSVLFARGTPYLTAFCHNASAERTFRIDRIVRIETLEG